MRYCLIICIITFTNLTFSSDDKNLENKMVTQFLNMKLSKTEILKSLDLLVKQGVIDKKSANQMRTQFKNIDEVKLNKTKNKVIGNARTENVLDEKTIINQLKTNKKQKSGFRLDELNN